MGEVVRRDRETKIGGCTSAVSAWDLYEQFREVLRAW